MFVLSDTVPSTLPSHLAFLPELPPLPTYPWNISYPTSHLLCPAGLSHGYCQHSYQSVPSFNLVYLSGHFLSVLMSLVSWHSHGIQIAAPHFPQRKFSVSQPGNAWLILLSLPGVLSVQFFGSLRISCKLYNVLFPEWKSQFQEAEKHLMVLTAALRILEETPA